MDAVFPIVPASPKAVYFLAAVCAFLLSVTAMLGFLAWSVRHSSVTVRPDAIRLFGDLWGRTIPMAALDVARARVVDFAAEPGLEPRSRRFGTGMPGYAAGWFGLANGDKALVYLTTRERVVYVPTREGYALLLSVDRPEAFLAALAAQR
jgi:hypothetical protein